MNSNEYHPNSNLVMIETAELIKYFFGDELNNLQSAIKREKREAITFHINNLYRMSEKYAAIPNVEYIPKETINKLDYATDLIGAKSVTDYSDDFLRTNFSKLHEIANKLDPPEKDKLGVGNKVGQTNYPYPIATLDSPYPDMPFF